MGKVVVAMCSICHSVGYNAHHCMGRLEYCHWYYLYHKRRNIFYFQLPKENFESYVALRSSDGNPAFFYCIETFLTATAAPMGSQLFCKNLDKLWKYNMKYDNIKASKRYIWVSPSVHEAVNEHVMRML